MKVVMNVPAHVVSDQFVTALEGGSNYWLHSSRLVKADVMPTKRPWYACPNVFEGKFAVELWYDDPKGHEGEGKGRKVITDADVRRGLALMASRCPKSFADVMDESGDIDTADVFMQHVLFGEVIYG